MSDVKPNLVEDLAAAVQKATGAAAEIDQAIARRFGVPEADYSGSAEHSHALAASLAPAWRLHVGYAANGIFPYASLTLGERSVVAEAPTLPLAVLRALFLALDG